MAQTTPTTILLIEDSPSDARLVEELLRSAPAGSFNLITASTLAEGLSRLAANHIDVILLDLSLPDSEERDTFRAVEERAPDLPIIIMTVSTDETLGLEAIRGGAQRFLSKDALTRDGAYAEMFPHVIRYAIEHKKVEAALAQSEEQFRTLFEESSVGQTLFDADGRPIRMNKAATKMLGIGGVEDVKHLTLFASSNVSEEDKARLRAGQRVRYEHRYDFSAIREGGYYQTIRTDVAYYDVHILPLLDASGTIVEGYLSQYVDITERKKAEDALQDTQRLAAIGQTATMIGHDLRNPLQALQLTVDLGHKLFNDIPPERKLDINSAKAERLFASVEQQIRYMDKIVADLQDYARPLQVEPETVHITPFVTEALGLLSIPESISVNVNIPGSLTAHIDPHLMRRALSNLILNAVQAMSQGGELTVSAEKGDAIVAITVHDTGEGVPENMREALFSPLTTGKAKGTGLGLAVVKRIVEAHNGTITFESEERGGTTFTVTLPQADG